VLRLGILGEEKQYEDLLFFAIEKAKTNSDWTSVLPALLELPLLQAASSVILSEQQQVVFTTICHLLSVRPVSS
jgi:hypothetical protein